MSNVQNGNFVAINNHYTNPEQQNKRTRKSIIHSNAKKRVIGKVYSRFWDMESRLFLKNDEKPCRLEKILPQGFSVYSVLSAH